jgi:hypothetical protein
MGTPLERDPNDSRSGAGAAGLTFILGLWYIASAWVYSPASSTAAAVWDSVVVGILIALFAAVRLSARTPSPAARWLDLLLGIWAFFSPWIFGFVPNEPRFINSLCVGIIVFALSISNSGSRPTVVHMR